MIDSYFCSPEVLDLIQFARVASAFYHELYHDLPEAISSLHEVPIPNQDEFWSANSLRNNRLLTERPKDGIILKSGGTIGQPKFSVFSRREWSWLTHAFAQKLARIGLKDGDRVANLFYPGELYGSFLFAHRVFEDCPVRLLQLPIAGTTAIPTIVKLLQEYEATVIAGLPTTLLSLASQVPDSTEVRLVLFAGEPLQLDQRAHLLNAFPNGEIRSIGYASTDAGLLGYCDLDCGPNEFRCYDGKIIFEIIDEITGEPIQRKGEEGRAVVTDLKRKVMPIIRYPVGDRAQWLEEEDSPARKFLLLGRSDESARIASITIHLGEIHDILDQFLDHLRTFQFQLVIVHHKTRDGLVVRIASEITDGETATYAHEIVQAIYRARPLYREFVEQQKVLPIDIEWRGRDGLEINSRTGKMKRVIDLRNK